MGIKKFFFNHFFIFGKLIVLKISKCSNFINVWGPLTLRRHFIASIYFTIPEVDFPNTIPPLELALIEIILLNVSIEYKQSHFVINYVSNSIDIFQKHFAGSFKIYSWQLCSDFFYHLSQNVSQNIENMYEYLIAFIKPLYSFVVFLHLTSSSSEITWQKI